MRPIPRVVSRFVLFIAGVVVAGVVVAGVVLTSLPSVYLRVANAQEKGASEEAKLLSRVRPILSNNCADCHSTETRAAGGLLVDSRASLLQGGKSGTAIVPGDPDASLLIQRLRESDAELRMPKRAAALSEDDVNTLREWIGKGAPWPAEVALGDGAKRDDAAAGAVQRVSNKRKPTLYPRPATPEQLAYFEKNVRPILVNRCYNCHSDAFKEAGGLRVDIGIAIFGGGNSGAVIIPGHPEQSLLLERLKSSDKKKRMPQEAEEALPDNEVKIIEQWIKDGAAWPDETEKLPQTPARIAARYEGLRKSHWAWQLRISPEVPTVDNALWSNSAIDRFVYARLQEKKLTPVGLADPVNLIRRVSYDLTGLPPTPQEIAAFQRDHSQAAYERLIDRLLASPRYGERWGRHWLDVARYAESSGPSRNIPYPHAWRYRNYVIDAYNRDIPFNRFVVEQIAGDQLPAATPEERDRLTIATGFLALGPKDVNQRFKARFKMDNVDDQIDTVTRSTMALTVSCARCHDHKFDPVPTTDYYALASIFTSTVDAAGVGSGMGGASLDYYDPKKLGYTSDATKAAKISDAEVKKLQDAAKELGKKVKEFEEDYQAKLKADPNSAPNGEVHRKQGIELYRLLTEASEAAKLANDAGDQGYGIHSARDGEITETSVRIRGVEERHGPVVPRGFVSLIHLPNAPAIPADHSGRLQLAEWITDPDNPLTARVYANRIWEHLFGVGIVNTVDNFGSTGDTPSNQALLDYLGGELIADGWSTKKLIREVVLSRAYRLSGEVPKGYRDIDAADRYIWRHAPRRLESEEIRDSILLASGTLDLNAPKGSPAMNLRMIELRDDGQVVHSILEAADHSPYRSIYLPQLRGEVPRPLAAFDPVTQTLVTGQREETTVPTQSLFLLNSPFVREKSAVLAKSTLAERNSTQNAKIRELFERVLNREPSREETERVSKFLAAYATKWSKDRNVAGSVPSAHVELASLNPADLTAGIPRSDSAEQFDDEDSDKKLPDASPARVKPGTPEEAAWTAFAQSLFASAEFLFAR